MTFQDQEEQRWLNAAMPKGLGALLCQFVQNLDELHLSSDPSRVIVLTLPGWKVEFRPERTKEEIAKEKIATLERRIAELEKLRVMP